MDVRLIVKHLNGTNAVPTAGVVLSHASFNVNCLVAKRVNRMTFNKHATIMFVPLTVKSRNGLYVSWTLLMWFSMFLVVRGHSQEPSKYTQTVLAFNVPKTKTRMKSPDPVAILPVKLPPQQHRVHLSVQISFERNQK